MSFAVSVADKWLCLANLIMYSEPLASGLFCFAMLTCLLYVYLIFLHINHGNTKLI